MVLVQKPKHVAVVNKINMFTDEIVSIENKSTILGFLIVMFAEFFYLCRFHPFIGHEGP
jgi:hypothetical protein